MYKTFPKKVSYAHGRASQKSMHGEDQKPHCKSPVHYYAFRLRRCGELKALGEGKDLHSHIKECGLSSHVYIGNLLVQMYGKCGALAYAESAFSEIEEPNVFSYSLMIAVYIQECQNRKADHLSHQMQQENVFMDKVTLISLLSACCSSRWLLVGKRIHACMMHLSSNLDVVMCTALVNMYGKCGNVECSRHVFDVIMNRNVISWNAMITAYTLNGHGYEALCMYDQMLVEGMIPNNVTLICVIDACACLGALHKGKSTHACINFDGYEPDVVVGNALINLYGKCGDIIDARKVFGQMQTHNLSSWNTIISAHGQHGNGEATLLLFKRMCKEGVIPDQITYFGLLSACSHSALVEEGCYYFTTMNNSTRVSPTVEHYNCMIDLLGRAGWLDYVEVLIKSMSVRPDLKSWVTLLGACRMHFDMPRAERIAEYMFNNLDSEYPTPYVLLANIYTSAGMPENAALVKRRMKDKAFNLTAD